MKRVSLAPVCLQVCNTFFFLMQNPSGELSKQVSICLSFASNSWVHFRAQGTTGLVTGTWVWAEVMTGREALTFQQPPPWDVQEIMSSSYPMTSSLAGIPIFSYGNSNRPLAKCFLGGEEAKETRLLKLWQSWVAAAWFQGLCSYLPVDSSIEIEPVDRTFLSYHAIVDC